MDLLSLQKLVQSVFSQVAPQLREMAKDAGQACTLHGCDALTIGTRCTACARRTCVGHTYWKVSVAPPKARALCPYCVLHENADLFRDHHDDDDEVVDGEVVDEGG